MDLGGGKLRDGEDFRFRSSSKLMDVCVVCFGRARVICVVCFGRSPPRKKRVGIAQMTNDAPKMVSQDVEGTERWTDVVEKAEEAVPDIVGLE